MQPTTIGLDLAKNVFQVRGASAHGGVLFRRKLRRFEVIEFFRDLEPGLVGVEACASAHNWARALSGLGHTRSCQ
jgi:transposase